MNKKSNNASVTQESPTDIINRIPDGVHLHTIREALSKGHASVMIGSGFSLNAQGGDKLPNWAQLIDGLLIDLYATENARRKAKERLGGISGMLRLAEEYAAVRGRAQLDVRMQELLPDAGVVMPGELHTKLLSLYWNDIFTTNYDTLLERALDNDRSSFIPQIKPRYQVVVAAHDVPFSRRDGRPRIVKLHGSLRTGTRLIVTEDDYRRYPVDFAPFVNTVQQSMLENVFCLIGFSGDDPNFLSWTGWARDHLGDKAPPVYLISFSPVSEGQRIILEQRKIFPINITALAQDNEQVNYAKALNALLDFWHEEPPVRRAKWPIRHFVQDISVHELEAKHLPNWIQFVRQLKNDYPGWLVAPADNRRRLASNTSVWMVMRALRLEKSGAPRWLKLVVLDEVLWISEVTLAPLSLFEADLIIAVLESNEDQRGDHLVPSLPDEAATLRPSSDALAVICFRLTLALLRSARENGKKENFKKWLEGLNDFPFNKLTSELQCELLHEQILFQLENRNKSLAIDLLNDLELAANRSTDPYWRIRAGALFAEVGAVRRGYELVKNGLRSIRDAIQYEGEATRLISREQWAEWVFSALDHAVKSENRERPSANITTNTRNRESWSPEPGLSIRIAQEEERAAPKKNQDQVIRDENARDNVEHPNFQMDALRFELNIAEEAIDNGSISIDARYITANKFTPRLRNEAMQAAVTYIRLVEYAALPPSLGNVGFTAKTLSICCRILSLIKGPESIVRIFSRMSSGTAQSAAEVLELPTIEGLELVTAQSIFDQIVAVIDSLTVDAKWNKGKMPSLRVLLEFSSRLAFRLDGDRAKALCDLALRLYSLPALRDDDSLHQVFSSFFTRALRLLSPEVLGATAPSLFLLSRKGIRYPERHIWPDVVRILQRSSVQISSSSAWEPVVEQVLSEAEESSAETDVDNREFVFRALDWLYKKGTMTEAQRNRFHALILSTSDQEGIPKISGFYRGAVLTWKGVAGQIMTQRFAKWLSTQNIETIEHVDDTDGSVRFVRGHVTEEFLSNLLLTKSKDVSFTWSEQDSLAVVKKLRIWWGEEGLRLLGSNHIWDDDNLIYRVRMIADVIFRVVSEAVSLRAIQENELDVWFEEIWDTSVKLKSPSTSLLFAGLRWWPEQEERVIDLLISAINTTREINAVFAAINSATIWFQALSAPTPSSQRYVHYLVDSIRTGIDFTLEFKLDSIEAILHAGGGQHFVPHRYALVSALYFLLLDLQNGAENTSNNFNPYSKPLLRESLVRLLVTMRKSIDGAATEPAWLAAMDIARSDPLLLIRKLDL